MLTGTVFHFESRLLSSWGESSDLMVWMRYQPGEADRLMDNCPVLPQGIRKIVWKASVKPGKPITFPTFVFYLFIRIIGPDIPGIDGGCDYGYESTRPLLV